MSQEWQPCYNWGHDNGGLTMSRKSFVAGAVVGATLFGAATTMAGGLIMGGTLGVPKGFGTAYAVCADEAGEVINGVEIKAFPYPVLGNGKTGIGVTFLCP